jgi:hypothetical protein
MLSEILMEGIQRGLRGENVTTTLTSNPNQFLPTKIGTVLPVGKQIYTLIGGEEGTGKTSFADALYVLNPFLHARRHGLEQQYTIYRSFERPLPFKLAKWLAYIIYYETKGQLEYSTATILSWASKSKALHEGDMDVIKKYIPILDELEECIDIIPGVAEPKDVALYAQGVAFQLGKYVQANNGKLFVNNEFVGELNRTETKNGITKRYFEGQLGRVYEGGRVYFPTTNKLVTHVVDHVSLFGEDKKIIDEHAKFIQGTARDIWGWQGIDLNQFNRLNASDSSQRGYYTLQNFKNTGTLTANADVVVVIVDPAHQRLANWNGYDITDTVESGENCFRGVQILKNSYGIRPSLGMAFYGAAGVFGELPSGQDMTERDYHILRMKQKPIFV